MPSAQPPHPRAKPWYRSKTLWFNAACAAVAAAEASLGLLKDTLPIDGYALLSFVLVVGNAALRASTRQGLSLRRHA